MPAPRQALDVLPVQTAPAVTARQATDEGLEAQPMAVAAFVGEEVRSKCLQQEDTMSAPRQALDVLPVQTAPAATARQPQMRVLEAQPMAVAAFVGEEVRSNACSRKTQCLHPDKPSMFACAGLPPPQQQGSPQMRVWEAQPMAVAAFVGGGKCAAMLAAGRHNACTQTSPRCLPVQDCPRGNSKAATDEGLEAQPMASCSIYWRGKLRSNACGRKDTMSAPRQTYDVCLCRLPPPQHLVLH